MPKEQKITQAEKEARVNKVYDMLIAGARRYTIHQYATHKANWNVTERQIDNYIADANALIAQEAEFHRAREFGRAKAALDDLYQKCMQVRDYSRAHAVRRELNALMALYQPPAPQTLIIQGVDTALLQVVTEALKQRGGDINAVLLAAMKRLDPDYVH